MPARVVQHQGPVEINGEHEAQHNVVHPRAETVRQVVYAN
jgi:hypothetical protein